METVNCDGEQKPLEEAAKTYEDKRCKLACSMHDTCRHLKEQLEGKKMRPDSQSGR
jgi:hypothetical protein